MVRHCTRRGRGFRYGFILAAFLLLAAGAAAFDRPATPEALWKKLAPFARPPAEFAGKFGPYRSPLKFADSSVARNAADWARRRGEILKTWHRRLGPWPPLVKRPTVKKLGKVERGGYTEYKVQVQALPEGKWLEGYLLIPDGPGPFPAVVVPFYEPLTSIGRGDKGRGVGTHDYGLQLVKRGFVTLSIGTPGSLSRRTGTLKNSNTVCLNGQPLAADLEARLGLRVRMENDANCFALAEALLGAGRGHELVFGVILGTGVGGGIVVGGKLWGGPQDIAGEWQALTAQIGQRAAGDAEEVGAAAWDYLFYSGYAVLAYWWTRAVAAADASSQSQAFKDAKRETARFYFARLLPRTRAHAAAIASGAKPLMSLDAALFDH